MRPSPGSLVYWKYKTDNHYRIGYCTYLNNPTLVRMGRWNGDTSGGVIVDSYDIDWREYRDHLR